ncbi:MAG: hypothetical protein DCF17_18375 [Shackletoniella antarctica]|uniref:BrnT family toxin n=1 Tax=Shackletoniella antarctica TaxID=268115 RepID=A0A2W4VS32_9CYAN|nr:MAG: hypothetical protein DCF17_18375 [Shackletoniella antarctica]
MRFEWNESKAARNVLKHRVSFEEAKTVFDAPLYVDFYNPDHSEDLAGAGAKRLDGKNTLISFSANVNSISGYIY